MDSAFMKAFCFISAFPSSSLTNQVSLAPQNSGQELMTCSGLLHCLDSIVLNSLWKFQFRSQTLEKWL
jgi:hypothetical protein